MLNVHNISKLKKKTKEIADFVQAPGDELYQPESFGSSNGPIIGVKLLPSGLRSFLIKQFLDFFLMD